MTKNLFTIVTYCHIVAQTSDLLLDYRYAQEEDSKWEQMIYLWRGLTLKQILENERTVNPLTHFPLKNKSFSTKLFS